MEKSHIFCLCLKNNMDHILNMNQNLKRSGNFWFELVNMELKVWHQSLHPKLESKNLLLLKSLKCFFQIKNLNKNFYLKKILFYINCILNTHKLHSCFVLGLQCIFLHLDAKFFLYHILYIYPSLESCNQGA